MPKHEYLRHIFVYFNSCSLYNSHHRHFKQAEAMTITLSILAYLVFITLFGILVGKFIKAGGSND